MSSWASQRFAVFSLRGFLWFGVGSVLLLSFFLYTPESVTRGAHPGALDWAFQSWPALLAMALATWLLLQGPLATTPSFVLKGTRLLMLFLTYAGFLYLLKWNLLWKSTPLLGLKNRNMAEGFLILVSTLVWLVASIRVLFRGSRVSAMGARSAGQEDGRPFPTKKGILVHRGKYRDLPLFLHPQVKPSRVLRKPLG
jgi:hypothetical protein